ncbi:branched-chain amino acid ABC transporter permease [Tepidibacillus sp. HK-1]|uniref:branched-chain amino acid ABC transporter permease n=1 Tax=Tepidibacillus sp. HK-1 TaxID=1883407 RepID=UPI000853515D|nr:branched-chain amino acid ABC transporter permease [Tepidibacillus sp. HK-1]GBF12565.1 high-affinity branched-chain amino acid transport system permease protein LivH [Tepidibacillus sp. HK-1]
MLTAIVQGLLMGSVYGLIALGLTLIFGIMRVINFAHGALLMISMYISYFSVTILGLHPYISLIIVAPVIFILGFLINHYLIAPVLAKEADVREPVSALLLTAGLMILLENLMLSIGGTDYKTIKVSFGASLEFADVIIPMDRLYAFFLAFISSGLFYWFLMKTEIGRAIRALGQDRNAAKLMGINSKKIFSIAFGVGMVLLGVAGVAILPFYSLHPILINKVFGTLAFVVVVLGGMGSIPGAIIGGLIIGVVQSVSTLYVSNTMAQVIVFAFFLIFLFIRPSGIFGFKYDS